MLFKFNFKLKNYHLSNINIYNLKQHYNYFNKIIKFISFDKITNYFFFFFPSEMKFNLKTHERINDVYYNNINFLRFKPNYHDIFRYYRRSWLGLFLKRNMRQHRTTRVIYYYACDNKFFINDYFKYKNKNNSCIEPSKQLLNWKYIV